MKAISYRGENQDIGILHYAHFCSSFSRTHKQIEFGHFFLIFILYKKDTILIKYLVVVQLHLYKIL